MAKFMEKLSPEIVGMLHFMVTISAETGTAPRRRGFLLDGRPGVLSHWRGLRLTTYWTARRRFCRWSIYGEPAESWGDSAFSWHVQLKRDCGDE